MHWTRRAVLAFSSLGALLLVGASAAAADVPPGTPTSHSTPGLAAVGPLFERGLQADHSCTGSVLDSPTGDLVLTAAHCLSGSGTGIEFVPGYDRGAQPYGVWTVSHIYLDPRWVTGQSPRFDYAILQVASHGATTLTDVTGGGYVLSLAPRAGQRILDVAYNAGSGDQALRCRTTAYYRSHYPAFNCHGYVGGSSGSPWLTPVKHGVTEVSGVIGGLHQGGCQEYTSYSSPFTADVFELADRAVAGMSPDIAPVAGSDGC